MSIQDNETDAQFLERMRPYLEWGPEYADEDGCWSSPSAPPNASDVQRALQLAAERDEAERKRQEAFEELAKSAFAEGDLRRRVERLAVRLEDANARADRLNDGWLPIEMAPRSFHPPLSPNNHHAPSILGVWGKAFWCVCNWGGPSQPFWVGDDNKKVPFQPTHWKPLEEGPGPLPPAPVTK